MGNIDLNALRNRLDSLQNKVKKNDNLWKPKPGKQQIRIVPYIHNEANPFIELNFYYNFGGKTILSPSSFGEADPILEFANELKKTGDRDNWNLSKRLTPKMRTYVPVIVRGEEEEGVRFWGFGKNVYQELLAFFADPDYGDLTDPTSGRDITVEFKTAKELGKNYPETYIRVKPKQTPVTEDKAIIKLLKDQQDLSTMFKKYEYDELKDMLKQWLETGNTSSEEKEETPESNAGAGTTESEAPFEADSVKSEVAEDVETAFKGLFNK